MAQDSLANNSILRAEQTFRALKKSIPEIAGADEDTDLFQAILEIQEFVEAEHMLEEPYQKLVKPECLEQFKQAVRCGDHFFENHVAMALLGDRYDFTAAKLRTFNASQVQRVDPPYLEDHVDHGSLATHIVQTTKDIIHRSIDDKALLTSVRVDTVGLPKWNHHSAA